MKLHEYQAKELLAKYDVPVNEGEVAHTPEQAEQIARRLGHPVMIKAQVMMGGRGKAGGVKYSKDVAEARKNAENILGKVLKNEQNPKGELVKLVLVDLSHLGGIERIVSFIGVGVLMLVIGYFSPVPPRKTEVSP